MYLCQYQNENLSFLFFFNQMDRKAKGVSCCGVAFCGTFRLSGLKKILRNTSARIFSFVVHFCFNCNPSFLFFFLIKRFSSGQQ